MIEGMEEKEKRRNKILVDITKKDLGRLPLPNKGTQVHAPKKGKGAYNRAKERKINY